VYVKGSELGYPLRTIERILEQNKLKVTHQNTQYQNIHTDKPLMNQSGADNENSLGNDSYLKPLPKIITELIKPERDNAQLPYQLTQTRKRKKALRPH
jgi:hypothetical protein